MIVNEIINTLVSNYGYCLAQMLRMNDSFEREYPCEAKAIRENHQDSIKALNNHLVSLEDANSRLKNELLHERAYSTHLQASLVASREAKVRLRDVTLASASEADPEILAEFQHDWVSFCDADPVAPDFPERMEAADLIEVRDVTKNDVEDDPFAYERGIEMGGMKWVLTEKGRRALEDYQHTDFPKHDKDAEKFPATSTLLSEPQP